jgi:hypothetical protein
VTTIELSPALGRETCELRSPSSFFVKRKTKRETLHDIRPRHTIYKTHLHTRHDVNAPSSLYFIHSLLTFNKTHFLYQTVLSRSETAARDPRQLCYSAPAHPGVHPTYNNLPYRTATYFNLPTHSTPPPAMDSMRHLSSSLPSTRRRNEQTHQLLSDFKAAALSVTNLYKTATAENARSRDAGYQDALDDLLVFLDKENLGLMDGEGWKVRQWATERLDDAPKATEDDEDSSSKDEVVETRSSSPEVQRKPAVSNSLVEEEQQRPASEPPQHAPLPTPQHQPTTHIAAASPTSAPVLDSFSFRSAQAYPTNHDRDDNQTMDLDPTSTAPARTAPKASSKPRHTAHNRSRDNNRASSGPTFNFNLGTGAGGKRKMPYPDFFDISGLNPDGNDNNNNNNNRREGGGRGGKKSRHV